MSELVFGCSQNAFKCKKLVKDKYKYIQVHLPDNAVLIANHHQRL